MINTRTKNIIATVCRIIFGLTFVFSGLAKTVDPWGTAIKLGEYFSVYGLPVVGEGVRMVLAILFCAAELMLGLAMLFGVKTRLASIFAVAVMIFFTILTFFSATWLPVGDCGCFGDALQLPPCISFAKNVVLLAMALVVWLNARRRFTILPVTLREWLYTALFACVSVGIGVWCYLHLPLVDFLPYKKGVDLYEAKYGDGESDISLMQFALFDSGGEVTREVLNHDGRVYMLCAGKLDKIGPRCAEKFAKIAEQAVAEGSKVVLITASPISPGETATFGQAPPVEVYNADRSTMLTMLRASTGLVVLDGGVILYKRNCRDME